MPYDTHDTIAAIASASGGAACGIVRISGRQALDIVEMCFEPADRQLLERLRRATALRGQVHITLHHAKPQPLACDLLLWPTERSYTREPVAELHTIGSPPLLEAVLAAVCAAGARLAEPGEFTLRAFLSGRLDLTQAEAVLGVIDAHGQGELSTALAQLAGGLGRPLNRLRDELVQLLAELEAGLDFVEEDIRFITPEQLRERLQGATAFLQQTIAQMTSRHTFKSANQVVLFGPPNVGKSSLFNAMAARGRPGTPVSHAIVSDRHGTTRDYLSATIDLDGLCCELVDTAGLQTDEAEPIEAAVSIHRAAQAMTAERRAAAAIRVLCVEMGSEAAAPGSGTSRLADVVVFTKADLVAHDAPLPMNMPTAAPVVATSSVTGQGLNALCATLRTLLTRETTVQQSQVVSATADRCRDSLRQAEAALGRAAEIVADGGGEEIVAAEIRDALHELGRVVGTVYTDDLLDRIFKTFCIGK